MPKNLSDTQAADVLRRAALLQAQSEHETGVGLSLDELKRAAEAAGIEGRYVEQAYLGAGDDQPPSAPFLGIQTSARRTRVVPGRVSEGEWGRMVAALRRQLGGTGEVETIGEVREWRRDPYHVLIEPEGENTRITASGWWRGDTVGMIGFTALLFAMALLMVAISIAEGTPDLLVVGAIFGASGIASGVFARPRLGAKGPRIEGKLDRVMETLEEIAGADERETADPSPEASGGARIDPSLLDAEPLSDTGSPRQRLRE